MKQDSLYQDLFLNISVILNKFLGKNYSYIVYQILLNPFIYLEILNLEAQPRLAKILSFFFRLIYVETSAEKLAFSHLGYVRSATDRLAGKIFAKYFE